MEGWQWGGLERRRGQQQAGPWPRVYSVAGEYPRDRHMGKPRGRTALYRRRIPQGGSDHTAGDSQGHAIITPQQERPATVRIAISVDCPRCHMLRVCVCDSLSLLSTPPVVDYRRRWSPCCGHGLIPGVRPFRWRERREHTVGKEPRVHVRFDEI